MEADIGITKPSKSSGASSSCGLSGSGISVGALGTSDDEGVWETSSLES